MTISTTAGGDLSSAIATPDMEGAGPTKDRIAALDFVRGVALFGILLMNMPGFGLPHAYSNPLNAGGAEGINLLSWTITQMGFEGTQRGLFSLLFGAGVILFTSRLEAQGRTDVADIYLRRNMWLIAFGMLNGYLLLWSGDILYFYGLTALLVFVFRNLSAKTLLAIGIGGLLITAAWNAKDTSDLFRNHDAYQASQSEDANLSLRERNWADSWESALKSHQPSAEEQQAYVERRTSGYWGALSQVAGETVHYESWGFYRWFFDIFSMMVIGMALFKMGVFTLERSNKYYLGLIVLGYGIGISVNVLETRWIIDNQFSLLAFSQAGISYDFGRLAMTAGHLGLLLLIARFGIFPVLQRALAAVGRMAFTNYLTHSVVCAIFFVGFGFFGELERHQLYYVVFAIWGAQLVISPIWLRYYKMGPLEWLWRYLTYGKRPPFRKLETTDAKLASTAS
jgi:uncharacterized protein